LTPFATVGQDGGVDAETIKAMLEQHVEYSGSGPDRGHLQLEPIAVVDTPAATHVRFRVVK
jgi:hypothetical protein